MQVGFSEPYKLIHNSVVRVIPDAMNSPDSQGSGVLLSEGSFVLTCEHCLAKDKDKKLIDPQIAFSGQTDDFTYLHTSIIAADANFDLALLKCDPASFPQGVIIPSVRISGSFEYLVGSDCFAIGYPLSQKCFQAVKAYISGFEEYNDEQYPTLNAALSIGNSGGPLFDMEGKLIGIVRARIGRVWDLMPFRSTQFHNELLDKLKERFDLTLDHNEKIEAILVDITFTLDKTIHSGLGQAVPSKCIFTFLRNVEDPDFRQYFQRYYTE